MRNRFLTIIPILILALAACGGGGGSGDSARPVIDDDAGPGHQVLAGVDQGFESFGGLSAVGGRAGVDIRHGTLRDGVGRPVVAAYLSSGSDGAVHRFHTAPEVRVIGPSTARERAMVDAAVEAINLSLPLEHRIEVGSPRPTFSLSDTTDAAGSIFYSREMLLGTIYVEFLPCAAYHACGRSAATSWSTGGSEASDRRSYVEFARGTVSHGDDRQGRILIAHELLHSLGMDEHVSQWLNSIVRGRDHYSPATATILTALDREGMQALYGRLDPGDDPTDFGPWASTSVHLVGDGRHADFGVALRNGYAEPWVSGAVPRTTLAGNQALSDRVTWEGALLGFSAENPVAGDASIAVNLGALTGAADFTGLESWAAGSAPGAAGTGTMWGDGDLGYSIEVAGNTFWETGGDEGVLTGIFTGAAHEGAAGTLERSDLTAAFGASR